MSDFDREVEENLPLVSYTLQKYFHKWTEDMFQTGCLGLVKAVKSYNPNKKINKSTYYVMCIKNEIGNVFRQTNCKKRESNKKAISLHTVISKYNNSDLPIYLEDFIADEFDLEENVIQKENIKILYKALNELNTKDKQIIMCLFGLCDYDKKTQEEIAEILGMTQANLSMYVKQILIRLRGKIENEINNRRL